MATTDWKARLSEERGKSNMKVTLIGLDNVGGGWSHNGNLLARADGKFFTVDGVGIGTSDREVHAWGQPMVKEVGVGVYVLVRNMSNTKFLVTIRQEPGNPAEKKHILLGCPLQASLSNIEQAHGGKPPPRVEFYSNAGVRWADAWKDGGRFIESKNRCGVLVLTAQQIEDDLKLLPNELLMSHDELRVAYLAGELNPYLREALGFALLM